MTIQPHDVQVEASCSTKPEIKPLRQACLTQELVTSTIDCFDQHVIGRPAFATVDDVDDRFSQKTGNCRAS